MNQATKKQYYLFEVLKMLEQLLQKEKPTTATPEGGDFEYNLSFFSNRKERKEILRDLEREWFATSYHFHGLIFKITEKGKELFKQLPQDPELRSFMETINFQGSLDRFLHPKGS